MTLPRIVMDRCHYLARCSEDAGAIARPFASEAMRCAHELVGEWMREAGMVVRKDNVGNLRGRLEGSGDATLLLGSHLDSVRDAGKYDGPLGVNVAIAALQRLHDQGRRLPFAVEVLGFADEEGLRFGSTYLGSRAVAGTFDLADLDRVDADGVTMREAIGAFGGDPDQLEDDRWQGERLLGYCEVHIEQGPVLEKHGLPVGVVSGIAAQERYSLSFRGVAGHAGTVPMDTRHDALVAAALFIETVEGYAQWHDGLVATVGQLTVQPGAANVIPGEVTISLDVRHAVDDELAMASDSLLDVASDIARHRGITVTVAKISEHDAVRCDPHLVSLMAQAIAESGIPAVSLPSGAGHDAVAMSELTGVGMLFVRCKGGVSHNPAESVTTEDVAVAIDVLTRFLELLAAPTSA
ncbi:MAG TPA: allantoate amidohydrolase [Candidatus Dormibacteraeota bacterium]|nr:allantoate amidohydrolase [Candidatus Dormibacteraeota bacterium]